ncbi:NUDIX hydrolase [Serinibacter arcticus]|uniref:NUDIX hydrolase n=1 Tax=Serinibacter arcticus TaxID=1655435 RepID=A0A2U1ZRM4_9MICO|nr:NUDIX hydrolase [Serinibacter arcticus]PWD49628.1 NUDIX hydrolase [Serinibacter arcticus]
MSATSQWQQVSSREVYGNPWISVTEDEVVRPDGGTGIYGVVEVRSPAVFVVAVDDEDRVVLVKVDRYTTGAGWEVPAGGSDGEDPITAGRRELLEEAGVTGGRWRIAGEVDSLNGVCRAPGTVVVAEGVVVGDGVGHDAAAEGISQVRTVEWSEIGDLVRRGEIRDGETLAALALAAITFGRWG